MRATACYQESTSTLLQVSLSQVFLPLYRIATICEDGTPSGTQPAITCKVFGPATGGIFMARIAFPVTLALGAILVAGNAATADDKVPAKSSFSSVSPSTMTLGGQGTAASAKAAPDSQLTWFPGYRAGYRNGFYRGYYGGGWGWGGYYPAYYPYAYPVGYGVGLYPPVVGFYGRFGGVAVGFGINGTAGDLAAPVVPLNLSGSGNPMILGGAKQGQSPAPPVQPGQFQYDGGPNAPVPLPKQDAGAPNSQATPNLPPSTGLPVSLPKAGTPPAKPYAYKGYGEK
jgi:hypothetical protein